MNTNEFEEIIGKIYNSVSGYDIEVPYAKCISLWENDKKVQLVHYILTRKYDFTSDAVFQNTDNYLVNFAFLRNLFNDNIVFSEEDVIEIINKLKNNETAFILYDTSGSSIFIDRVIALFPPKKSERITSALKEYKDLLEKTEIAFEKARAKTKKSVLKTLKKQLK